MKESFVHSYKPLLTVMLMCETPEVLTGRIRNALCEGADIAKIVTGAETMEQQLENLRITDLLRRELGIPFLFLSGGQCSMHRRLGIHLGCCMALCTYEHDQNSSFPQPMLRDMKQIRDELAF